MCEDEKEVGRLKFNTMLRFDMHLPSYFTFPLVLLKVPPLTIEGETPSVANNLLISSRFRAE